MELNMKIIRTKELSEMLSISRSTICRLRRKGAFPEPIQLGPKIVGWELSSIEEWLESLKK
jgi:prophage regulatory protein